MRKLTPKQVLDTKMLVEGWWRIRAYCLLRDLNYYKMLSAVKCGRPVPFEVRRVGTHIYARDKQQ